MNNRRRSVLNFKAQFFISFLLTEASFDDKAHRLGFERYVKRYLQTTGLCMFVLCLPYHVEVCLQVTLIPRTSGKIWIGQFYLFISTAHQICFVFQPKTSFLWEFELKIYLLCCSYELHFTLMHDDKILSNFKLFCQIVFKE